jgi:hypothetical protein
LFFCSHWKDAGARPQGAGVALGCFCVAFAPRAHKTVVGSMPNNMSIYSYKMDMLNYYSLPVCAFGGILRVLREALGNIDLRVRRSKKEMLGYTRNFDRLNLLFNNFIG